MYFRLWNQESIDEKTTFQHAEHSIAHLKQGSTCAGDTALEGPDTGEEPCRVGVLSMNAERGMERMVM